MNKKTTKKQAVVGSPAVGDKVADLLLQIDAVGFSPQDPIQFKSGLWSPVYVDNRKLPYFPKLWQEVVSGWTIIIKKNKLRFDAIAGIETAGVPHSAVLGFTLRKPSLFIRKQSKGHGLKKLVEGGDVDGLKVLLVEDHVTTGGSSLRGVEALRLAGAQVNDCLTVTSYDFPQAKQAFSKAKVKVHTLTTFDKILSAALSRGLIKTNERQAVESWLGDPEAWSSKHKS